MGFARRLQVVEDKIVLLARRRWSVRDSMKSKRFSVVEGRDAGPKDGGGVTD